MASHEPPSLPTSPLPKRARISANSVAENNTAAMATVTTNGNFQSEIDLSKSTANHDAASTSTNEALQVKLLHSKAKAPTKGSAFSAGYDMYSAETTSVPARGQALVSTQIAIAVPPGTYGRVAPRSGLAVKHSITTGAGVIDYDYRGEVRVLLYNLSDKDFAVNEGDRIAQLVLEKIVTPEVVITDELSSTERGAGGFGSTGGFGRNLIVEETKKSM